MSTVGIPGHSHSWQSQGLSDGQLWLREALWFCGGALPCTAVRDTDTLSPSLSSRDVVWRLAQPRFTLHMFSHKEVSPDKTLTAWIPSWHLLFGEPRLTIISPAFLGYREERMKNIKALAQLNHVKTHVSALAWNVAPAITMLLNTSHYCQAALRLIVKRIWT